MDKVEINPTYIIENRGKKYVLYAGLLDAAHRNGLRGITTNLVQVARPDNGDITIVTAVVTMDGDGPDERHIYTGHGEVGKRDTPIALQNPIRMAETRAKARAFRDALNASEYVLEGDEDGDRPTPEDPKRTTPAFPRSERAVEAPVEDQQLPVMSIKDVISEAQSRFPDKVKVGANRTAKVDGRPEHDRGDDYRGDKTLDKRPTEYDTDPEKLERAHTVWDTLSDEAALLGITVEQPTPRTWNSVSLMRAEWAKLNRQVRAKKPSPGTVAATPPVDDAPPPEQE